MPATDRILVVHQALVALVAASADFWTAMKGRTSNFLHDDSLRDRWQAKAKTNKAPDCFPMVILTPARGREAPGAVQTFCQRVASQVMPYTFSVIGEGTEIVTIGQVAAEIEAAVKAAGVQLGMPTIVATSRFSGRVYERAPREIVGETVRRQVTVGVEVTIKG